MASDENDYEYINIGGSNYDDTAVECEVEDETEVKMELDDVSDTDDSYYDDDDDIDLEDDQIEPTAKRRPICEGSMMIVLHGMRIEADDKFHKTIVCSFASEWWQKQLTNIKKDNFPQANAIHCSIKHLIPGECVQYPVKSKSSNTFVIPQQFMLMRIIPSLSDTACLLQHDILNDREYTIIPKTYKMTNDAVRGIYQYALYTKYSVKPNHWVDRNPAIGPGPNTKSTIQNDCCWANMLILSTGFNQFELLMLDHNNCVNANNSARIRLIGEVAQKWFTQIRRVGDLKM